MRHLHIALITTTFASVVIPTTAAAFQQTQTCNQFGIYACRPGEIPLPVQWSTRELTYKINEVGSDDLPRDQDGKIAREVQDAIVASFEPWLSQECAGLNIKFTGLTSSDYVGYDKNNENFNVVMWKEDWPYAGASSAYALTSVTFSASTGVIADADIELNGDDFTWTDSDIPAETIVDLRNTLTHEVGHFIGLDHSNIADATMFAMAPEGEVKKRDLTQDDIDGLCTIYPPLPEGKEPRDGVCNCASVSSPSTPVSFPFVLGLAGLLLIRSRRRS